MPNRHEDSVLSYERAVTVRIHASEITDVVPVRLEPAKHGIFVREEITRCIERPVVTDSVGAAGGASRIETVSTVVIVGLPGCVGRLHPNVGMAGIIADDEKHGTGLARIQPCESGIIDP